MKLNKVKNTNLGLVIYVDTRPDLFKVQENLFHMSGYGFLKQMYTEEEAKARSKAITLYFPERFINMVQQRDLVNRLAKFGYEEAAIYTSSPFILQMVEKEHLLIISCDDRAIDKSFTLCDTKSHIPDDSGLNFI